MRQFSHPAIARYLVWADGIPRAVVPPTCATALLGIFGTATLPRFRRRGVQTALVAHVLDEAAGRADLAIATTEPGSTSQRVFERLGFRLIYTRAILVKAILRAEAFGLRLGPVEGPAPEARRPKPGARSLALGARCHSHSPRHGPPRTARRSRVADERSARLRIAFVNVFFAGAPGSAMGAGRCGPFARRGADSGGRGRAIRPGFASRGHHPDPRAFRSCRARSSRCSPSGTFRSRASARTAVPDGPRRLPAA